jgi:hypothetical protein
MMGAEAGLVYLVDLHQVGVEGNSRPHTYNSTRKRCGLDSANESKDATVLVW